MCDKKDVMIGYLEYYISSAHVGSWIFVIVVSINSDPKIPIANETAKPIGYFIFMVGMISLTWGLLTLKGAFLGNVKPVSSELVQSGPYQYIRHPIYLSMVISTLGLTFGMRSVWGMVVTIFLFGVLSIIRARLEEDELAKIHGVDWEEYVNKTSFIIPFPW
jgi:protein-S-isoprenylcysteine O-methyltransferase Ste14